MSTASQDKKEIVLKTQTYGIKKFTAPCFDTDPFPPAYRFRKAIEFQPVIFYKEARMNGDEKMDAPKRPLPEDGKITWVTGRVDAQHVYGEPLGDGEHYCYECRYDAGPLDEEWMKECDQNYLARINGSQKNQSASSTVSTPKVSVSAISANQNKEDKKAEGCMRLVVYATDANTNYPEEGEFNSEQVCLNIQVLYKTLSLPATRKDWAVLLDRSLLYPPEIFEIPLKYSSLSNAEMERIASQLREEYDLTFLCDKRPIKERHNTALDDLRKQFFEGLDAVLKTKCVSSVKSISSSGESKLLVSTSSNSCLSSTATEAVSSSSSLSSASVNTSAINLLSNSMASCVLASNNANTSLSTTETKAQAMSPGKLG